MAIIDEPLVSIGMPAYNGERYIGRALDSLLAQDYKNFELLISDNASTDATLQICKEYASKNNCISVYTHSHNVGSLENFKTVLKLARGKYFMWAAVDDYWHPQFISKMVKELENHPEAGVAMCGVDRVYENGQLFDTIRFIGKDNPNHKTYYQMLKGLTSGRKYNLYIYGLFRTQLLKRAIKFLPEVPGSDRLFICQMALATRFRYVDQILHVRTHHSQPSHVRLPDEKFNRMKNEDRLVDLKILFALGKMIYSSDVIPWNRKFYFPVALWRYGFILLVDRIAPKVKERVSPTIWKRVKEIYKIVQ